MDSPVHKARVRKSRFGCRNCKIRKLKCDEQKPHCMKCRTYGVVCNFASDIPDIQSLWGTGDKFKLQTYLCLGSPKASVSNAIWASDGVKFINLDAHDHDLFTRFRYRTLYSLGGAELVNIYEQHMLPAAFSCPFLMHGSLAVAAVHNRYLCSTTSTQNDSLRETYHLSQCTTLFNRWLGGPVKEEHKDPLWAAAGSLAILTFASIGPSSPTGAWPLAAPTATDLDWLRLGTGKMALWKLVDPLRSSSVFRVLHQNMLYLREWVPVKGSDGLLPDLAELCDLHEESTIENNPYIKVAHCISRLLRLKMDENADDLVYLTAGQMHGMFESRLLAKDPVALLLLALWYSKARNCKWWIDFRARYELPAILRYLHDFHADDGIISKSLSRMELR